MKIAVVCNYKLLPERIGGMDYFFWNFDQKCKEKGIQIDWFFPNDSKHEGYSKLHIISSELQNTEKFFLRYCLLNKPIYTHVFTHFVELCTPIFKKLKEETKAKIIAVDHNPRPIDGYPFLIKIKKTLKGWFYAKYIDVFVAVSEYSKQHIIKDFGPTSGKNTIVIFNGIEVEKFIQKSNFELTGKFVVAAHLRFEKGIQDLIKAANDLVKEGDYHFTIDVFGSGNYEHTLTEMVNEYQLQNYFRFKGSVTDLHERLAAYDYLVHPSHGETFCYSIIESLLANLPVITTKNEGNVLGMVKDKINGFLFEREDTNELKNILKNILNQNIQINDCAELNKAVHIFSLEKMVENYLKLIY